jgi:tetratricopeptide (TPR) repeat protein
VPFSVWVLLVLCAVGLIAFTLLFADRREPRLSQVVMVVVITTLVTSGLVTIAFLDNAYGEHRGAIEPQAMAEILGDTGDPRCRGRESIAMVMTVGSVVFRPEDGPVWVGTGEAPTSHGAFVPFSIEAMGHAPDRGELVVRQPADAAAAFERFRRAYVAYLDDGDARSAREHARAACEARPSESLYHALRGLLSIALADAEDAEAAFDRALELGHPDEERIASFHLWRGRARDLLGRREDALNDYRLALGHHADPQVRTAATRGLRRPYTERAARRVNVDVGLADVIQP